MIQIKEPKFAPREIFEQILEWSVIPTFDLVIEYNNQGVILVKRKIAPYQNQWALPGLRMLKGEDINDTLSRIVMHELGLKANLSKNRFLGQHVGKFTTEHNRQDVSTRYHIKLNSQKEIKLNDKHFSSMKIINSRNEIPANIGAMYKFYLNKYFELKKRII